MSKLNITNETIKLAKAIKIADPSTPINFVVYGENEESTILIENWEKLNEEQLKNVFPFVDWKKVFGTKNLKTFSEESVCKFLNIAIPYVERYVKEYGEFKSSSLEYRTQWYLYDCLCTCTIPSSYWGRILKLTESLISAFYSWQPLDENNIECLIESGMKYDMDAILMHHKMSEQFMEKHEELMDWNLVSEF